MLRLNEPFFPAPGPLSSSFSGPEKNLCVPGSLRALLTSPTAQRGNSRGARSTQVSAGTHPYTTMVWWLDTHRISELEPTFLWQNSGHFLAMTTS